MPLDRVLSLYQNILSRKELKLLSKVDGIKGVDARTALNSVPGLLDIRISREQAAELFPLAAKPYWEKISQRMKGLRRADTLPSVQEILLSLAYNRGAFNKNLEPLKQPVLERLWSEVAGLVANMQQGHKLQDIRIRRRQEGKLLAAELDFKESV